MARIPESEALKSFAFSLCFSSCSSGLEALTAYYVQQCLGKKTMKNLLSSFVQCDAPRLQKLNQIPKQVQSVLSAFISPSRVKFLVVSLDHPRCRSSNGIELKCLGKDCFKGDSEEEPGCFY